MISRSPTNLRPGLLVSLKTSIKGNVKYEKTIIQSTTEEADGASIAQWETIRRIADAAEHKLATEIRSKARAIIGRVCAASEFGLLCPEDRREQLNEALDEADTVVNQFNAGARLSRIELNVVTGRIEPNDERALRAINSEVRDLLEQMQQGIQNLNVDMVRTAANKARSVGQMLTPEAYAKVSDAIAVARSTARRIVKAGEVAAQEIDTQAIRAIAEARTAFLDLDDAADVQAPEAEGRAVELEPEVQREVGSYQPQAAQIEL